MNKKKYIIIVLAISVVISLLIIPNIIYRLNEQIVCQEIVTEDFDISSIESGDFIGSYQTGHMSANVEVFIENGEYTSVRLVQSVGINPSRAQKVAEAIVRYQTITPDDGDIGTQYTDKIVQKAVYYAILYNYKDNK